MNKPSNQLAKFFKLSNIVLTTFAFILTLDLFLPTQTFETTVTENEFTKVRSRGVTKTYNKNVTLITDHGNIMVDNRNLQDFTTNHRFKQNPQQAILNKTLLFGIGKKINIVTLDYLELKTTKPLYSGLIWLTLLIFGFGLLVSLSGNYWIQTNIGSFNLILVIFWLIMLFTNRGEIGMNEY